MLGEQASKNLKKKKKKSDAHDLLRQKLFFFLF